MGPAAPGLRKGPPGCSSSRGSGTGGTGSCRESGELTASLCESGLTCLRVPTWPGLCCCGRHEEEQLGEGEDEDGEEKATATGKRELGQAKQRSTCLVQAEGKAEEEKAEGEAEKPEATAFSTRQLDFDSLWRPRKRRRKASESD